MTTPPPAMPRPYSIRKRIIGGGIIAGVVGLAIWLGNLGLGPGLGPGPGGGGGGDAGDSDSNQTSDTMQGRDDASDSVDNASETDVSEIGQPLLRVLISGSEYRMAMADQDADVSLTDFAPATLQQIVDVAVNMELDEDERRVLILHDATGESGAHSDLRQALRDAGLTPEIQFDSTREAFSPSPQ